MSFSNDELYLNASLKLLSWYKKPTQSFNGNIKNQKWFEDGILNACYNVLDRHASEKTAVIVSDNNNEYKHHTYNELLRSTCEFAGVLKRLNVKKGDCVTIYMPMCYEAIVAVLGCSRIGAIHNVVFAGFSAESLRQRIVRADSRVVITCETVERERRKVNFLKTVESALTGCDMKIDVLIFDCSSSSENKSTYNDLETSFRKRSNNINSETENNINVILYDDVVVKGEFIECEKMNSEDVMFYLYTSGSTGSPKAMVHTTAGYLLYIMMTLKNRFRFFSDSIMCCTADIGWITGHSYMLYAPLLIGGTTIIMGGTPFYPDHLRIFKMISDLKVTHLYTAPTVIRILKQRVKNEEAGEYDIKSLKLIGTVGEPIGEEAYYWYKKIFGGVPVIDTYFQTETGGFLITPVVGREFDAGCVGNAFFGLKPVLLNEVENEQLLIAKMENGTVPLNEIETGETFLIQNIEKPTLHLEQKSLEDKLFYSLKQNENLINNYDAMNKSLLLIKGVWPGIARTMLKDHSTYEKTYFITIGNITYFKTGDEAVISGSLNGGCCGKIKCKLAMKCDCPLKNDFGKGCVWIKGRTDDVINVSGHRISTVEIESAVYKTKNIAQAAVVGIPDDITGQSICVFAVATVAGESNEIMQSIRESIRKIIGPIASPKNVIISPGIPITRTGKIMRRLLKNLMTENELGDMSACANPEIIEIIKEKVKK